jgi:hypothetical protein
MTPRLPQGTAPTRYNKSSRAWPVQCESLGLRNRPWHVRRHIGMRRPGPPGDGWSANALSTHHEETVVTRRRGAYVERPTLGTVETRCGSYQPISTAGPSHPQAPKRSTPIPRVDRCFAHEGAMVGQGLQRHRHRRPPRTHARAPLVEDLYGDAWADVFVDVGTPRTVCKHQPIWSLRMWYGQGRSMGSRCNDG